MKISQKFEIVLSTYIYKSKEDFVDLITKVLLLIVAYLLFESTVENGITEYWVKYVLKNIQSTNTILVFSCFILLTYSKNQIKSKNFLLKPAELFILFFYVKYRFFDLIWSFRPLSYDIKYFDALPAIIIISKATAFIQFYKSIVSPGNDKGIIDPDIPLGPANPNDELKRDKFARDLVEVLKDIKPSQRALTIGINGAWGSGKTSLQYLIETTLPIDKFHVVNFNPWFHTNGKLLSHSFLEAVKSSLALEQHIISKSVSRYANTLLHETEGILFKTRFSALLTAEPSLESEFKRVKERIKNLQKTLLVIIDDLDRLTGEEITEVLRLIRLVGDFPNTIYILLYDRNYLKNELSKVIKEVNVGTYLDKIVQVEYPIPELNPDHVQQITLNHLTKSLTVAIQGKTWSREQINLAINTDSFRSIVKNLRDVKRFTNNFLLRYKSIHHEVNFKQFILLELIRYKSPSFTSVIYRNKNIFLSQFERIDGFTKPDIPIDHEFWNELVKSETLRQLLLEVAKYKNEPMSISEAPFFENYFTLTLQDNFISETQFQENLSNPITEDNISKYDIWINDSLDILIYRIRNHPQPDSIKSLQIYIEHLHTIDKMIRTTKNYDQQTSTEISEIFISKYLQFSSEHPNDSKELHNTISTYLFKHGDSPTDQLQQIFRKSTRFVVKIDYQDSPLSYGWKEAESQNIDHLNSIFIPGTNHSGAKQIHFNAPFSYRFDFDFKIPQTIFRNARFELAFYDKEWAFYIKINAFKGDQYYTLFFRILNQQSHPQKASEVEVTVGIKPISSIDNWATYELDIQELFNRSFGSENFSLLSITGISIRGFLGFSSFELF